jgi:hypothetical protein
VQRPILIFDRQGDTSMVWELGRWDHNHVCVKNNRILADMWNITFTGSQRFDYGKRAGKAATLEANG